MSVTSDPVCARVSDLNGRPTLFLNGKPQAPHIYGLTDCPGARFSWEEVPFYHIKRFAEADVRLFQLMLWEEWLFPDDETDELDLTAAKQQIAGVLKARPDAVVFFRYHLNTTHRWNLLHPDECVQYADTGYLPAIKGRMHRPVDDDEKAVLRVSLASELWKTRSARRLRKFLGALAETPEGRVLAGIQVACGVFGEWHQWGFLRNEPDVSPAMRRYFRQWLQEKYVNDDALRRAWQSPDIDLARADFPTMAERQHADDGIFRDPSKARKIADYYEALQSVAPRAILHFCREIRHSWPRDIVTSAFHGYFKFLFGRAAIGGHTRVAELLKSPDIDSLCAPQSYNGYCREIGGSGESRGLVDACRRAGKLWLDEMDQNTHLGSILVPNVAENSAEDIGVMRRNILYPFCHGGGAWYYDFGPFNFAGAWDRPELMEEVSRLQHLQSGLLEREAPFERHADVLVVYDDQTFYHQVADWRIDSVTQNAVDIFPAMLARTGVAFETAYLHELERLDMSPFKVVVFANTFLIDADQRQMIERRVKRGGRHLIWFYLPGYNDGERLSLTHTESLTGFRLRLHQPPESPRLTMSSAWMPEVMETLEFKAPGLQLEGCSVDLSAKVPENATRWHPIPFPVLAKEQAEVWGRIDDNYPAAATMQMGECTSWIAPFPVKTVTALRAILRHSGAHIYCEHEGTLTAGGGVILIHAGTAGERTVNLGGGLSVSLKLQRGESRVLNLDDGSILL